MYARYIRHISRSPVSIGLTWIAATLLVGGALFAIVRQAQASGPSGLLPNLVGTPPEEVEFEVSNDNGGLSTEPEEPKLLLRFNGYVHNDGHGALDMRGSRMAPSISSGARAEVQQREKELQEAKEGKRPEEPAEFSETTEQALTTPPMKVFQRLFTTNEGAPKSNPEESQEALEEFNKENKQYLERPNQEEASSAEMMFVNADGHHHWHLQHVAKYSLWNADKSAEVAPAQKVGFCLEDSEHIEPARGPESPAYSDDVAPYRDFCQRYKPYATSVYEGISPGWRDKYGYELGLQWVDVSNVLPGEYWLREEVNPEHNVMEEQRGEKTAYAIEPTIVPGFDAEPSLVHTPVNTPIGIVATSRAWNDEGEPDYEIVTQPQHGKIEAEIGTNKAVYTPDAGYTGTDSFTYLAYDPESEFPRHPAVATVSIDVGTQTPSVAIAGAPAEMIAGTSVQLSALTNDGAEVTWSASSGLITSNGLYTAPTEPPVGGMVIVTARSSTGAEQQITILIRSVPPAQDETAAPLSSATSHSSSSAGSLSSGSPSTPGTTNPSSSAKPSARAPLLYRPDVELIGRRLIMTTKVGEAGRVRLSAYIGHHLLGTCVAKTPAKRSFSCRLTLGKNVRLNARISVLAILQTGHTVLRSLRKASPIPQMKMRMGGTSSRRSMRMSMGS